MLIAQLKRKENIAEYLIYMWQVEDLLRVCQFDDAKIDQLLVSRFTNFPEVDDLRLQEIRQWYLQLRDMMLAEGCRENGHIQIVQNILIDLTDLHLQLLKHGQDAIYTSCFYSTLPIIVDLRSKEGNQQCGELETCFLALYGVLMLKLQKREISQETQLAIHQISKFLAILSDKYRQWKAGELKLDED